MVIGKSWLFSLIFQFSNSLIDYLLAVSLIDDFYDFYGFYGFYDLNGLNGLNDLNDLPFSTDYWLLITGY